MNRQVIYTEAAKERLRFLHFKVDREVEKYFEETKLVPGDEIIEITGSDIEKISDRIRISSPRGSQAFIKQAILLAYTFSGVLFIAIGIFYSEVKEIFEREPVRLAFILSGVIMVFFSMLSVNLLSLKSKKEDAERRQSAEREIEDMKGKIKNM